MTLEQGVPQREEQQQICRFIYKDHFQNDKIVFECEASDILVADELYRKEIGLDPVSQAHVGCCMLKDTLDTK